MAEETDASLYPTQDGPGASGARTEIMVRVMVGRERTIVLVSSPGTPTTRIVAGPDRIAAAAGQRVAEPIDEALQSAAGQPE